MMEQKMLYCNEFDKMKATTERPPSFRRNPDFRFSFFRRKIWKIWNEL